MIGKYILLEGFIYKILFEQGNAFRLYCVKTQKYAYVDIDVLYLHIKLKKVRILGRLAEVLYE